MLEKRAIVTRLALARVSEILTVPLPRADDVSIAAQEEQGLQLRAGQSALAEARRAEKQISAHGRPYASCRGNRGDRDRVYGEVFTRRLRAMGIRDRPIVPRSPWPEQLIGSLRAAMANDSSKKAIIEAKNASTSQQALNNMD